MAWHDKLAGLFKLDAKLDLRQFFHKFINITNNNYHFHITGNPEKPIAEIQEDGIRLITNLKKLPPHEKKKALALLKEGFEKGEYLFLEEKAEAEVRDIKKIEASNDTVGFMAEIKEFAPSSDIPIIRAAIYMRAKFKESRETGQKLKEEIGYKHGKRGRNIALLISADYFEKLIIPLYKEIKLVGGMDKFKKLYHIIIEETGFAVFVHSGMKKEEIKKQIEAKIKTNKLYGLRYVNIHGIGSVNVKNIRNVADKIVSEDQSTRKTIDEKTGDSIYVRLEFENGKSESGEENISLQ